MPRGRPRIAKSKANITTRRVTSSLSRQPDLPHEDHRIQPFNQVTPARDPPLRDPSSSQDISHLDVALLNNLITRLEALPDVVMLVQYVRVNIQLLNVL